MSVETRGAGKEKVALRRTPAAQVKLAPSRQRDASVAPDYTVVDAKGDLIAKGHFEFG
jgi:hypothetical protein